MKSGSLALRQTAVQQQMADYALDIRQRRPIAEVEFLNPRIDRDEAVAIGDEDGGAGENASDFNDVRLIHGVLPSDAPRRALFLVAKWDASSKAGGHSVASTDGGARHWGILQRQSGEYACEKCASINYRHKDVN